MKLVRLHQSDVETLGHLIGDDERLICRTLERPWLDNAPQVSCIPSSTYTCRRRHSEHFNCEVFEITGVPGRSDILIHPANYVGQLRGCVALGTSFVDINRDGVEDITSSHQAFDTFMASMEGVDTFTLTIIDPSP